MNNYYTYAYLREDGTPYYIGKGRGKRWKRDCDRVTSKPSNPNRIIKLKQNLTEEEAFKHEIYMIAVFGRKDLGTGILRNMTNGGDGNSGRVFSPESRQKMSESHKKYYENINPEIQKERNKKRSEKQKGKVVIMNDEWKNNISEAAKRRYERGEIPQLNRKGKTPWNKGKKNIYSEETLQKIRESAKNRKKKT